MCQFWIKKLGSFREVLERYDVKVPEEPPEAMNDAGDRLLQVKDYLQPIEDEVTMNINYINQMETRISEQIEYRCVLQVCGELPLTNGSDEKSFDAGYSSGA